MSTVGFPQESNMNQTVHMVRTTSLSECPFCRRRFSRVGRGDHRSTTKDSCSWTRPAAVSPRALGRKQRRPNWALSFVCNSTGRPAAYWSDWAYQYVQASRNRHQTVGRLPSTNQLTAPKKETVGWPQRLEGTVRVSGKLEIVKNSVASACVRKGPLAASRAFR